MDYIHWRNLTGVTHTETEVKAMAAEYEYKDGPNDEGDFFMRAGKV
jgi:ubiquinol-cytochrome c reductase cytochrome c1 subunit